jgi:hypothetical protein
MNGRDTTAMKLRIDTTSVTFTRTRTPEPRTNFETGQPRVDKAIGKRLWLVQVMALDGSGGDVIGVTVADKPKVSGDRAPVVSASTRAGEWRIAARQAMHEGT